MTNFEDLERIQIFEFKVLKIYLFYAILVFIYYYFYLFYFFIIKSFCRKTLHQHSNSARATRTADGARLLRVGVRLRSVCLIFLSRASSDSTLVQPRFRLFLLPAINLWRYVHKLFVLNLKY